ncbi:MAG TPA: hypothetical protein HA362_00940 [Nanoarchaeota archaeon]|nr:hypothetical protein [Nanoarchaeota archaeon]
MEQLIRLFEQGQSLEYGRFRMYSQLSKKVISPEGKQMLVFLAKAEKRHLGILKKKAEKLREKRVIKEEKLPKPIAWNGFSITSNAIKQGSIIGDINIIEEAIRSEKYDVPFYSNLAKKCKNKAAKSLFLTLKKEEAMHIRLLNQTRVLLRKESVRLSAVQSSRMMFLNAARVQKH